MNIHVFDTQSALAKAAANLFASQLLRKPDSVLGLATGSSPIESYREIVKLYQDKVISFAKAKSFNLDEYVGLDSKHPCSYHAFMQENLFNFVNLSETRVPDGMARDLDAECRRYDRMIRAAGGIDLQLLGIGHNGHIGFNEPGKDFIYDTHVVNLTESTIKANRRFFEDESQVPRQAVSMGCGIILESKSILLIAMGQEKAEAVRGMFLESITPALPASILRAHRDVTVLLDKPAASLL